MREGSQLFHSPAVPTESLLEPLLTLQIRIWLGISRDSIRPIDWARSDWSPTLVLTGTQDKRARPAESEGIFQNIPAPNKRIAYFDGAGHQDLFAFDSVGYAARIKGFLDSGLTAFSPGPGGEVRVGRAPVERSPALPPAGAASGR
jgi:pimeloyl-ACP methyl ester carboxylesterase